MKPPLRPIYALFVALSLLTGKKSSNFLASTLPTTTIHLPSRHPRTHTHTHTDVILGQTFLSACQIQYLNQMGAIGKGSVANKTYTFIDPATQDANCQLALCQGDYNTCFQPGKQAPTENLYLVFSDEFEEQGRKFGVEDQDARWTAGDLYYFPTQDIEVYKPEQVTTWNGKAVITLEKAFPPLSAKSLQPDGKIWDVTKNYKSGMMNSWNKWCYTGGYLEMSVQLPGNDQIPGFWPAFWAMGNLGRAGYMPSTAGLWPYSYDVCGDGSSQATATPGSKVPSQILPQCVQKPYDQEYINRTKYGMQEGVARNAPEFDVFEVIVTPGGGSSASQTLQMAPLLPPGQSWTDLQFYDDNNLADGVNYPGALTYLNTNFNGWTGVNGRPGNEYQDSISAVSHLNSSFYTGQHTFGVDWAPGEYMRWYVDGLFAYEINPNALLPRTGTYSNGTQYTIGERMIPVEPMYIIFNLGMSKDFGEVDIENLQIPAYMLVDYIRVYQRGDKMNVGCSPPEKPTDQWINCHKEDYMTSSKDEILFGPCSGVWVCGSRIVVVLSIGLSILLHSFFSFQ